MTPREIDVVDEIEEVVRIDAVRRHQSGERGAVGVEIALLHPPRLGRIDAEQALDIVAHADVDQLEQVAAVRIEAVVEIEDPAFDMGEVGGHGPAPSRIAARRAKRLNRPRALGARIRTSRSRVGRQLRRRISNWVGPIRRTPSPQKLTRLLRPALVDHQPEIADRRAPIGRRW